MVDDSPHIVYSEYNLTPNKTVEEKRAYVDMELMGCPSKSSALSHCSAPGKEMS